MPYISKNEYDRLLSKDSVVDALLAVWADTHGQPEQARKLFKSMEEKMKEQLGVQDPNKWADEEYKKFSSHFDSR